MAKTDPSSDTQKKNGPDPKYEKDFHCKVAKICAAAGLTDVETSKQLEIARSTLNLWKKKYPEFKKAMKVGKNYSDEKVIKSLYERALGYAYQETEIIDGPKGVTTRESNKEMAPDVTAMIFWLKNRRPEEWRDRHDINVTGNVDYQKQRKKITDIFKKENK